MTSEPKRKRGENEMDEVIGQAREAMTVRRVFGDPIEKDGIVVIPAANVRGGAGGGSGREGEARSGWGGGFGLMASPAGAFVIQNGAVRWRPALDVNRIVLGAQIVALIALLVIRSLAKTGAKVAARR